jgi:two-component system CheB/CheR fusion protein
VRRVVRELVLFAPHDLLKDSPFSRLDLISCRNLLIYLNREAQSRAFDIFHFALQPGGRLFLGTSESVDEGNPLFAVLDKKQRLYVQRPGAQRLISVPTGPGMLARWRCRSGRGSGLRFRGA